MEKPFRCKYYPVCVKSFSRKDNMLSHVAYVHKNRLCCDVCLENNILHFFNSKNSLKVHVWRHHTAKEPCRLCGNSFVHLVKHKCRYRQPISRSATKKIRASVRVVSRQEYDFEIPQAPRDLSTVHGRGKNLAHGVEVFNFYMHEFKEWLECPASLGKSRVIRNPTVIINKFRTVMGKFAFYFNVTQEKLFIQLSSSKSILCAENINKFLSILSSKKLKYSTIYNYIRPIYLFITYLVAIKDMKNLEHLQLMLCGTSKHLSYLKKKEFDPEAKSDYLNQLPSHEEIMKYFNEVIQVKVNQVIEIMDAEGGFTPSEKAWKLLVTLRNFLIVMMLVSIPPQRKQVLQQLSLDNYSKKEGRYVFEISEHKTSSTYGKIIVLLPEQHNLVFEKYIWMRKLFSKPDCKSLFINRLGSPEANLTKIFQEIIRAKFNVSMNIKDCRNLYIQQASKVCSLQEMHRLSKLMYHSFKTQQETYNVGSSFKQALEFSIVTERIRSEKQSDKNIEECNDVKPIGNISFDSDDEFYQEVFQYMDKISV